MKAKAIDIVYKCVANHKKVTMYGIAHATGLPKSVVERSVADLVTLGRVKERSWIHRGDKVSIPCYVPNELFKQPNLLFNDDMQAQVGEE